MSKIHSSGPGSVNRSSATSNIASGSFQRAGKVTINETFTIPWQKIKMTSAKALQQLTLDDELVLILSKVFIAILRLDASIVPTPPRKRNAVIAEASFSPPQHSQDHPKILLPLPGIKEELQSAKHTLSLFELEYLARNYISRFLPYLNRQEIIKLIIISSHEFGHLQSYRQGNHTEALAIGIQHLGQGNASANIIENFTWLVFKEEFQAWHYAARLLKPFKFNYSEVFDQVKNASLATYIQELKLERASLKTCYRLASFGDDFVKNCRSHFFSRPGVK